MLIFALLAVFIAGLMVGRTPEYLGKKIQATEMKLVALYLLIVPTLDPRLRGGLGAARPGEGVDPQPRCPRALGGRLRVHVGVEQQRLGLRRPDRKHRLVQHDARPRDARRAASCRSCSCSRSPARSRASSRFPPPPGTFPTGTPLFAGLLVGVVLIVVALTYFPVLALGPILEHLSL